MSDYKHPEVLVSTDWAAHNLNSPNLRLVEVDVDTTAYDQGHIPGAVGWNWQTQLQDNIRRDLIDKSTLEKLLSASGISNGTTILLYGDNNNWFAAYALWQLKYYGHKDVRLINGGRKKWLEENRQLSTEATKVTPASYHVSGTDESLRAHKEEVFAILDGRKPGQLVDVRSVDEFTGKIIAPPGMTETAQRAGHIPQAANIPWVQASNEDGTFKSFDELKKTLRIQGHYRQRRSHRLLSHRRAQLAHLVRPQVSSGLQPSAQLRRLLDRMGQPHRRPHRQRNARTRR